ncbi:MAG: hypothetical protein AAGH42_05875 [Pseudomonadota bacterium]
MTIFTALFGAGLVLLLVRDKPTPTQIVLKRLFWLAIFGAIHLIFIREGDILAKYALVGFLAIFFVKMNAFSLIVTGLTLQLVMFVAGIAFPIQYGDIPLLWQDGPEMH